MKTTVEIPDQVFRRAKARAAERGQSLKDFFTEALRRNLASRSSGSNVDDPDWMRGFGALGKLHDETARIQRKIDRIFGVIEPEDQE